MNGVAVGAQCRDTRRTAGNEDRVVHDRRHRHEPMVGHHLTARDLERAQMRCQHVRRRPGLGERGFHGGDRRAVDAVGRQNGDLASTGFQ